MLPELRVESWSDHKIEEIFTILNACLSTQHEKFLYRHPHHPKFRKDLFFLLTENRKVVSTFACRPINLAGAPWRTMLFGDVATAPNAHGRGYMRLLVEKALKQLQSREKVDIIMNQWTGQNIYEGMYAKFGFSVVDHMRTMVGYYKRITRFGSHVPRRNMFSSWLHHCQDAFLRGIYAFDNRLPECSYKLRKLSNLSALDVVQLNYLYENYCHENGDFYLTRDRELWEYLMREKTLSVLRNGDKMVAYAIVSQADKHYIIEELVADSWSRFLGSLMVLEKYAAADNFHTMEVYTDGRCLKLAKYRFFLIPLIRMFPYDPRCLMVFRLLKNFILRIHTSKCTLMVWDDFLDWEVTVGTGATRVECSQKSFADFLSGRPISKFLRQARVFPKSRWSEAKSAMEDLKVRYQIPIGFRCNLDSY